MIQGEGYLYSTPLPNRGPLKFFSGGYIFKNIGLKFYKGCGSFHKAPSILEVLYNEKSCLLLRKTSMKVFGVL